MRISGGLLKGRRIATKKSLCERLRPTSAKVREAIFDIIKNRIIGTSFVDLYAGTGTIGLEALSRGAERVVFVEPNRIRARMIKENLQKLGFNENSIVVGKKAIDFLKKASIEDKRFDVFFLDPPYFSDEIINALPIIAENKLLADNGLVIVEHFFKKKLPESIGELRVLRNYRYGDTMLTIYTKEKNK